MAASPGSLPHLLPENLRLRLDTIEQQDGAIQIFAHLIGRTASCPACHPRSSHLHSRYVRTLSDLPWQGAVVRLRLRTRRFYCRSRDCRRKVFTERLLPIADSYGRQTNRLTEVLQLLGYALGGEAGFRCRPQKCD